MPEASHSTSCFKFMLVTYLAGFNHSKLYCYDFDLNEYRILIDLNPNTTKVITGNKNELFVIENRGNIYSSKVGTINSFQIVANTNMEDDDIFGNNLVFNYCSYFGCGEIIYKFSMKTRQVQAIGIDE